MCILYLDIKRKIKMQNYEFYFNFNWPEEGKEPLIKNCKKIKEVL